MCSPARAARGAAGRRGRGGGGRRRRRDGRGRRQRRGDVHAALARTWAGIAREMRSRLLALLDLDFRHAGLFQQLDQFLDLANIHALLSFCQGRGRGRADGQFVAQGAEADDPADGDVGEVGMVAEFLACRTFRQVHFDEGQPHRQQRVAERDAGVREGARIDDEEAMPAAGRRCMRSISSCSALHLRTFELMAELARQRGGPLLDLGQAARPVRVGLARAEQVQVRAVQ